MKQNQLENVLVFAARYAHHRPTGASMMVCRAIISEWDNLRHSAQTQLQRESLDATCNDDDWQEIRKLTAKEPE